MILARRKTLRLDLLAVLVTALASVPPAAAGPFRDAAADGTLGETAEAASFVQRVNIIDGADERDSLLTIGPSLGLSPTEIARIRKVSGHVGCFLPSPSVGTGALFLTNRQIITAGHILFDSDGQPRSKCFFRNQDPEPLTIDLVLGSENTRFGATPPKAGSNQDYAIVRLAEPVLDAKPFPVAETQPIAKGDALIVITAHPAGMEREVDPGVPVAQGCTVRRVPISTAATSFYRTDCDATGSSSGGMHLSRVDGELVFRGITITTGPWRDESFRGAPYDERGGSVTTALGTDEEIFEAGTSLAAGQ
jgi:hypothetical protein